MNPTLDEFLTVNRPANPDYTDHELTQFWKAEYPVSDDATNPAPSIPNAPSLNEFLEVNRPANPDYTDYELTQFWKDEYKVKEPAAIESPGPLGTAKDLGLKTAQGVVGLGQSTVGLLDLASYGKVGEVMRDSGYYKPEEWKSYLGEFMSQAQKSSDRAVSEAEGFVPTLVAALNNPRSIAGSVFESLPQLASMGLVAKKVATKIAMRAAKAEGGLSTEAGKLAAQEAVSKAANKLIWSAAATEGAMAAGQIADAAQGEGRTYSQYALPSIVAGVMTAVIGRTGAKIVGGSAEIPLFTGTTVGGITGNVGVRVAKSALSEGVLEELPQSAQEQIFQNIALGKEWDEGVGNAAAMGTLAGSVMGAGMGAAQGSSVIIRPNTAEEIQTDKDRTQPVIAPPDPLPKPPRPQTETGTVESVTPVLEAGSVDEAIEATQANVGIPDQGVDLSVPKTVGGIDDFIKTQDIEELEAATQSIPTEIPLPATQSIETAPIMEQPANVEQDEISQLRQEMEEDAIAHKATVDALAREDETFQEKVEVLPEPVVEAPHAPVIEATPIEAEQAKLQAQKKPRLTKKEQALKKQGKLTVITEATLLNNYSDVFFSYQPDRQKKMDVAQNRLRDVGLPIPSEEALDEHRMQREVAVFATNSMGMAGTERGGRADHYETSKGTGGTSEQTYWKSATDQWYRDMTTVKGKGTSGALPAWSAKKVTKEIQVLMDHPPGAPLSENSTRLRDTILADPAYTTAGVFEEKAGYGIDNQAQEAATSKTNNLPQPTQPQKEAGNYKVGRVKVAGLDISIENPVGSERSGTDRGGKPWKITMKSHYGYILGTVGKDKDHLDTFIKPGTPEDYSGPVFVVNQKDPKTGTFDEHKIVLGGASLAEAKQLYQENYAKGWDGIQSIAEMSMDDFKGWLETGNTKIAVPAPSLQANVKTDDVTEDTRGKGIQYHGTSRAIDGPLNDDTYATQNIYGQGFYTTDAQDVAKGYMKKGSIRAKREGKQPGLYAVRKKHELKLFNMEEGLNQQDREMVIDNLEEIIPEDESHLKSLRDFYDEAREMSEGEGLSADSVQEMFDSIRYNLEKQGFDGLHHIGGTQTGRKPHRVEIIWNPSEKVSLSDYGEAPTSSDKMRDAILTEGQPLFENKKDYGTPLQKDRRDAPKADGQDTPTTRRETVQARTDRTQTGIREGSNPTSIPNDRTSPPIRVGSGVRTISKQLARRRQSDKRVDLRGQDASTTEKLAELGQIFRDPTYETLRVIFMKGNNIAHHLGITSRMPSAVVGFMDADQSARFVGEMKAMAKRFGADSYYLMHNHPSGKATPSQADIVSSEVIAARMESGRVPLTYRGHVVINHNQFAVISPQNRATLYPIKNIDFRAQAELGHPLNGRKIDGPHAVAAMGKELQTPDQYATIIYTTNDPDSGFAVSTAIQEVPIKFIASDDFPGYIRNSTREFGALSAIAYMEDPNDSVQTHTKRHVKSGLLTDGVFLRGTSVESLIETVTPRSRQFQEQGKDVREVTAERVQEPEPSYGVTGPNADNPAYAITEPSYFDKVIRMFADKTVDIKRYVETLKASKKKIADELNAVYVEEAYHKRVALQSEDLNRAELRPIIDMMRIEKVTPEYLDKYLHARTAVESNAYLARVNPALENDPDYDYKALSGMTDKKAGEILAAANKPQMERLVKKVDGIINRSRDLMVEYGLETQEKVDAIRGAYQFYVPLYVETKETLRRHGQGKSVKGSTIQARLGSLEERMPILASIAQDRETIISRGEKMRPVIAFAGMMMENPDKRIAYLDKYAPITYYDNEQKRDVTVPGNLGKYTMPTVRYMSEKTGKVEWMPDPDYKGRSNVVNFRLQGIDYAIIFNEKNERATQMAIAFKDLDTPELSTVMAYMANGTRYLASVNTQWNPIFGIVNFVRDFQFAGLTLSSTPIKGQGNKVRKYALASMGSIFKETRAVRQSNPDGSVSHHDSEWAQWFRRFEKAGGPTGYRDIFATSNDRARDFKRMVNPTKFQNAWDNYGRIATLDLLSDYNSMMENSVRLGAFRTAIESGMSDLAAMSIAKNLTVNFNKKGQQSAQLGALYAFFNASVQGSFRIYETLFDIDQTTGSPKFKNGRGGLSQAGRNIIAGGVLLGMMQTVLLGAAGFDDDDIPEFIKSKNIIIPTFVGKGYVSIPMPLGFNVIPNAGRLAIEAAMYGKLTKRVWDMTISTFDMFSPVGGASTVSQFITPTVADPIIALDENTDWTGRDIVREDFSTLKETPGHTRAKYTATPWAHGLSVFFNWATGGTDYMAGGFSPSPDAIDYLIGQVTGGVGREVSKAAQVAKSLTTGENLPLHKVPIVGRFAGSASGGSAIRNRFYRNLKALNALKGEIDGRRRNQEPFDDFLKEHPEARIADLAMKTQREVSKRNKRKHLMIKRGAGVKEIQLIDAHIDSMMQRVNDRMEALQ